MSSNVDDPRRYMLSDGFCREPNRQTSLLDNSPLLKWLASATVVLCIYPGKGKHAEFNADGQMGMFMIFLDTLSDPCSQESPSGICDT